MFTKKEIGIVVAMAIVIGFCFSFLQPLQTIFLTILLVFIVFAINILAKKISGFYLETDTETQIWGVQRYGFKPQRQFKKPLLMGAFLPVITAILSFKYFIWMAPFTFEVKPKVYRAARRHGLYKFSEMTESHLAFIAASGIVANLAFGVIGYFMGLPEFSRLNLYYAMFNMIPLSDLDGNKIFFGNLVLWSFLATLVLIGLICALVII